MLNEHRPPIHLSATQFDRRHARTIDSVVAGGRAVIILRHGRAVAAVVPIADFVAFTGKPLDNFTTEDLDLLEAAALAHEEKPQ